MRLTKLNFEDLIQNQIYCLTTEGKSQKTIEWYTANLKRFSRFLKSRNMSKSVGDIGIPEVRRFIYHLQNEVVRWEDSPHIRDSGRLSPFSVQGYVRTIKAFWSWLVTEGYIEKNPMTALKVPKAPKKVIETFSQEQIKKMISILDLKTPAGYRDYTIILILLDTGIRLSELINLEIDNIDLQQSTFLVTGKGNKERVVPFGTQVRRAIWRYLTTNRPEPAHLEISQLFLTGSGFPLRPRSVQSMISRLGSRAGISGVRFSPHTFRHSFAKQYLMNGGDVFSLQRILGHSSLDMVNRYINLASQDISERHRWSSPVDNMVIAKNKQVPRIIGKRWRGPT